MKSARRFATLTIGALVIALCVNTRAGDVVQNVPNDALGFAVIKNLIATDAKVEKLLKTFHANYPPPLVFLEAVTGIREGLDPHGDLLIAVLPPGANQKDEPQYCVWLPVTDYDRLLALLEATPGDRISTVRVADEDLLIARQGDSALLLDPDQRARMEQMLSATPSPPATVAAWNGWINENNVTIVLLQPGIQQILAWSAEPTKENEPGADDEPADDLFGLAKDPRENNAIAAANGKPASNPLYDPIRNAIHKWIVRTPEAKSLVADAEAIGGAARLDDAGNAFNSLRLKSTKSGTWGAANADTSLPPALYENGDFVANGAGHLPPDLMKAVASAHVHKTLDDLITAERISLGAELAAEFQKASLAMASDVAAWAIVHQPGDLKSGVFNNNHLVVRVPSAKRFVEHVGDVVQHWNNMHREVKGDAHYVFDIEETKVGERPATQFVLDMIAADNLPPLPETRAMMEKFFGPGGKMRWWLVPLDEHIILLTAGTPEQTLAALQMLNRQQTIDWNKPETAAANKLLPGTVDWRFFYSPRGHYNWERRRNEAMFSGVPVIGAKPAKDFPESPPIAVSGKVRDNELEVDAAVTAETIKSAGEYFTK